MFYCANHRLKTPSKNPLTFSGGKKKTKPTYLRVLGLIPAALNAHRTPWKGQIR